MFKSSTSLNEKKKSKLFGLDCYGNVSSNGTFTCKSIKLQFHIKYNCFCITRLRYVNGLSTCEVEIQCMGNQQGRWRIQMFIPCYNSTFFKFNNTQLFISNNNKHDKFTNTAPQILLILVNPIHILLHQHILWQQYAQISIWYE